VNNPHPKDELGGPTTRAPFRTAKNEEEEDLPKPLTDVAHLREENSLLAQRVEDLEQLVDEYRAQMAKVLSSSSWRITAPLRMTAGKVRWRRQRLIRTLRGLGRAGRLAAPTVHTTGLFPPLPEELPDTSPLRHSVDVNRLRRPPTAEGPQRRPPGHPRLLVAAHVHYPELWIEMAQRLARMPEPFDLLVSVTEGHGDQASADIRAVYPEAIIEVTHNQGRDWAPLVSQANRGLLSGYTAIARIHAKKSHHRSDGDAWRSDLLDGVLPDPESIERIVSLLDEDRGVGLVVPSGHVLGPEHWGSNLGLVSALAYRMTMAFDPGELAFPAGGMFWCRPWLLERLADLALDIDDFEIEVGQFDGTTAHALERLVGVMATVAGLDIIEHLDVPRRLREIDRADSTKPEIFCFYLPQYHQCDENDRFWGSGFTDWVNVKKAVPQFTGHRQPITPSDEVGYYDLSVASVLQHQWDLARGFGINGFIFHYYWFDGVRVLDRPLMNWLANPSISMPLAICWANENWTRRWDGLDSEVLLEQRYDSDWAGRFWQDLLPVMGDPRYLHMNGRPVVLVYRPLDLPKGGTANLISAFPRSSEIPDPYVIGVEPPRGRPPLGEHELRYLDAVVEFPPNSPLPLASLREHVVPIPLVPSYADVYGYREAAQDPRSGVLQCVMPGWDNSSRRRQDAYVFHGSNPVTFRRHLSHVQPGSPLFINAWNEFAEGAVMEPTHRFGEGYLTALTDRWR
jgi:lipopolysaccharide biosynthesis protein